MLVYRIENLYGLGPYSYRWPGAEDILPSSGDEHHPSPQGSDSVLREKIAVRFGLPRFNCVNIPSSWVFGFASLAQYHAWVYREDWRRQLDEIGGRLVVRDAPEVIHSSYQAIFPSSSPIIKTLCLFDLTAKPFVSPRHHPKEAKSLWRMRQMRREECLLHSDIDALLNF